MMGNSINEQNREHLGVVIAVLNPEGNKILLGERINSYKSDWFGLPGGRLELKERLIDCGKRELMEEVGIVPITIEYVGVARELQNNAYNFIHFGMVVKSFSGDIQNTEPHKSKGWQWFPLNNLPDKILPGHRAIIEMYLQPNSPNYKDLL